MVGLVEAQARSYDYESIIYDIKVNPDTTFDVSERQTFNFNGEYHAATRDIPLRGLSSISRISVIDGTTGKALLHSYKRLDKLDPSSWGKYTTYRSGGEQHIEWYYNLANTPHTWVINYQVHGGLAFYRDHDELYWNLLTNYSAPISNVEATVKLPNNNFSRADLELTPYASSVEPQAQILDNQTVLFEAYNLPPQEKLTIAVGWPKGLVSERAFWLSWFRFNWGYLLAGLIALGSFLYGLIFWYKTEKHNFGRGTVVPQYDPPQNLKPAMAEVIVKERITTKAWPATIVDLAVRGYLRIEEEKPSWGSMVATIFSVLVIAMMVSLVVLSIGTRILLSSGVTLAVMIGLLFMITVRVVTAINQGPKLRFRDYRIDKIDSTGPSPSLLEDYEKKFLDLLFAGKDYFSTKEFRKHGNTTKREFAMAMRKLEIDLYRETERDTAAYEVGPSKESRKNLTWLLLIFGSIFGFAFLGAILAPLGLSFQLVFLIWITFVAWLALRAFIKYEARLSKDGQILKEDWLGFKLYLATAEKYRLQNLTPDLFEKYLPYAIIFGVEKKWGHAFSSITMSPPSWYHSSGGSSFSPSIGGGFSASVFSASFASSFTSAFGSSGASGASGGGGGAGGGGGGGGGGAS